MTQRFLPAVFIRGGSSKGVFFHAKDLPGDSTTRDRAILAVLGSPDPYGRQLNGMGGGISSLSKVVIVGPPSHPEADIDYTFGQVAVDRPLVDYGANCGNLSSAVGPFAVDEGLIRCQDGPAMVRLYNTNTRKIIHAHFRVAGGGAETEGDLEIPGVAGRGSPIRLDFLSPGGSATQSLLPTGKAIETLDVGNGDQFQVSLVDATNPVVFIEASSIGLTGAESPDEIEAKPGLMSLLDRIRRAGGVAMGMAKTPEQVPLSGPKISLVSAPQNFVTLDKATISSEKFDIGSRIISMERAHRATTLTGAMCLGTAVHVPGTIPHALCRNDRNGGETRIGNPSGVISVDAEVSADGHAERASVFRTARRLMQGAVGVPASLFPVD